MQQCDQVRRSCRKTVIPSLLLYCFLWGGGRIRCSLAYVILAPGPPRQILVSFNHVHQIHLPPHVIQHMHYKLQFSFILEDYRPWQTISLISFKLVRNQSHSFRRLSGLFSKFTISKFVSSNVGVSTSSFLTLKLFEFYF